MHQVMPVVYHVSGTVLECYQIYTHQRWPTLPSWKTVLLTMWNDLWPEFIDINEIVSLCNTLRLCVATTGRRSYSV